jgi:hypothetical protein
MLVNVKRALLALVCTVTVIQLGGCVYDRHGRPSDHERPKQHDRAPDHPELDIRVH